MEYKSIVVLHRRGKIISFFLKNDSSIFIENIVDVLVEEIPKIRIKMNILEALAECRKGSIIKLPLEDGNKYLVNVVEHPFMTSKIVYAEYICDEDSPPKDMKSLCTEDLERVDKDDLERTDYSIVTQEEMLGDLMKQFKEYFEEDL